MIITITADWQIHGTPPHDRIDEKTQRSTRFAETVETVERILDAGMAAGSEGLLFLGDLTEHKKPTPLELTAAAGLFMRVMDKGGFVWALAGNHDGSIYSQSSSSIEPLARMRKEQLKLFHDVEVDLQLGMLAIPYIHQATPEQIRTLVVNAYAKARAAEYEVPPISPTKFFAAAHYGVTGCEVGPRNLVLPGDYLGADQFAMDLQKLDRIFCGHIHKAQQLSLAGVPAYLPGSPTIQDMGERNDKKTWLLFDTVTREVIVKDIPQRRRFIDVPYAEAMMAPSWTEDDVLKISGGYTKPDYPKDTMEELFTKKGFPRPFSLTFDVKAESATRAARSTTITAEGGLRAAMQQYLGEAYTNHSGKANTVAPAAAMVLDLIEEQGMKLYHPVVEPYAITIKDFLTFHSYRDIFNHGAPVLIVGKNGIGKTNFFEAILWALTGQTSKGLSLAAVVRQNLQEATVVLDLVGHDGAGGSPQRYRVTRSVKLAKSGKPKHSVDVVLVDKDGALQLRNDGQVDSLSDGGVDEVQAKIDALVGGSYLTLKTTAFMFQNDASPFIRTKPTERKAVIGEITGQAPLQRAYKILDKKRLESQAASKSAEDRLGGMIAVAENQDTRVAELTQQLEAAKAERDRLAVELPAADNAVAAAELINTKAKADVTNARAQLDQLPNTEAAVTIAEQALVTFQANYTAAREVKAKRYNELKAQITELEKKLATLQAPDQARIQLLVVQAPAAELGAEEAEKLYNAAKSDSTLADMAYTASLASLGVAQAELVTNKAKLDTLGALEPLEALQAQLVAAQGQLDEASADMQTIAGESAKHQAAFDGAKARVEQAVKDKAAFDGQDQGNCSRCGQAIDSTHIKKELDRIGAEEAQAFLEQKSAELLYGDAQGQLVDAIRLKTAAQGDVTRLTEKIQKTNLDNQARATVLTQQIDLEAKVALLFQASLGLEVAKLTTAGNAERMLPQATTSRQNARELTAELTRLKDQAAALAADQGKLAALAEEHTKNTAAGVADDEAMKLEVARLQTLIDKAKQDHAVGQQVRAALQAALSKKEEEQLAVANVHLQALLKQKEVKGQVEAQDQLLKNVQASLQAIEDQKKAVEAALFELGTLKQRAEIDALACKLVDPKTGLPVYLIDQALPFLEDRINLYMGQLGMDQLVVSLDTQEGDTETLAVLVDNGRPGPRLDIAAFSGGQLDRVECAMKGAMADLARQSRGVTFGLVCYDEPTGGLDEDGKQGLVKLFHERAGAYPVTLIISHDEELIRSFDTQLKFSQGANDETVVAA